VTPIDPLAVAVQVARILEQLRIPYVIGGSVASSLLGRPRSTLDLDIMIDAQEDDIRRLARALLSDFYVDEEDAAAASKSSVSFNAIHLQTSLKVDFFPAEELGREQIARRQAITVPGLSPLYFYSAEDLIIRKLLWFRQGGESSALQWLDVVSILKTTRLDTGRLVRFAREQKIEELLLRAASDAGIRL
jgi:hypothetical protein